MWYLQNGDAAEGPLDDQQIFDLIRAGSITRQTPVWTEGMVDWTAAGDTVLADRLRSVPPPIKKPTALPPLLVSTTPPVQLATGPLPAGFRDPSLLCNWLTALLVLSLLFGLVAIWSSSQQLELLERIKVRGQFTMAEVTANDTRQQLIGIIQLVIFITTVILFGRWIYIAAKNVRALGAQDLLFTPGWAVGYYFVPVVTLWKPYQAMKEIWKASRSPKNWESEKGSFILGFWWTFWIISCLVGQMSLRAALSPKTPNAFTDAATYTMFSDVIDIPLCIFAIILIRTLSARQLETAANVA